MKVNQTTVERMAWWIVFLVLLSNIAIFIKLNTSIMNGKRSRDQQLHAIQANENVLLCIIKAPPSVIAGTPAQHNAFIDQCVKDNP